MPKITELYCYIAEDAGPEDEGVAAFLGPGGMWMPMVGADKVRMEALRPMALTIATQLGKPLRLVRFTRREELELVKPQ